MDALHVTRNAFVISSHSSIFISSVMNLLAEIYSQPEMVPKMLATAASGEKGEFDLNEASQIAEQQDRLTSIENPYGLAILTPRLWPFMRHSITSVRRSAIRTLVCILSIRFVLIVVLLCHTFHNLIN